MIRRSFLKMLLASPLLGFLKKKEPEGLSLKQLLRCKEELEKASIKPDENGMIDISRNIGTSGHFWMQTYGPYYNPIDIDPHWDTVASSLKGVYSGKELIGVKASERNIWDVIILNDGRRFLCFELDERTYMKEGSLGVFLK